MKVKIYIEGGGDQAKLKRECRRAFSKFFENAGFRGKMPSVVACGSRNNAYDDFCIAMRNSSNGTVALLLVDSEARVLPQYQREGAFRPWEHLHARDGWDKPAGADDDQVHLMVQCMEAWILADRECLKDFFGSGLRGNVLPTCSEVESIDKRSIYTVLKDATRDTQKGKYGKGAHSFGIIELINPDKVFRSSKWARRLKAILDEKL